MNGIVNIAEMRVAFTPTILVCIGLGSCIGVTLYDATEKIGGLAHIMLPNSQVARGEINLAKFADTAIENLLLNMIKNGANKNRIKAKIFGGANMFSSVTSGEIMSVGERNIIAVIAQLHYNVIPIIAKDIGGTNGRTIYFDLYSGKVTVKIPKTNEERIF